MPLWITYRQEHDFLRVRWVPKGEYERIETSGDIQFHRDANDQCTGVRLVNFGYWLEHDRLADIDVPDCPYEGPLVFAGDVVQRATVLYGAYPTELDIRID